MPGSKAPRRVAARNKVCGPEQGQTLGRTGPRALLLEGGPDRTLGCLGKGGVRTKIALIMLINKKNDVFEVQTTIPHVLAQHMFWQMFWHMSWQNNIIGPRARPMGEHQPESGLWRIRPGALV